MRSGILYLGLAFAAMLAAQTETQQASANVPETVTHEQPATFRTGVNLVMVPVVVRDKQGRAVGGLQQEDFQLFDRGKPQLITRFTVEKSGVIVKGVPKGAVPKEPEKPPERVLTTAMPDRFIAYLFDDLHSDFGDMARIRDAAGRHIDALGVTDRAAIYTTSGQTQLEFTDDRAALHETLLSLRPRPISSRSFTDCPDLTYYMADMIQNHSDPSLMQALIAETVVCMHLPDATGVDQMVRAAASRVYSVGNQETRVALSVIREVIRRMSGMPGQRIIVVASQGFIATDSQQEKTDLLDRAIRYNVVINAIDERGLYTDPLFDASRPGTINTLYARIKDQYERDGIRAQADVLAELAAGTGGTFVENTNDLDSGYKRVATMPEYVYVLGFSPQNLKLDGSFHALKVSLKDPGGLGAQARRGYYAPKHLNDAVETAKEEIREAIFSREELHELPIDLHTQYFKSTNVNARVTVLAHLDLKHMHFKKAEGRNRNDLTITAALFDRNGNYVTGNQKLVEMRLKDETLDLRGEAGFTVRSTFDVKPGSYLVRLVVRDAEGQQMSAANSAVEIP